tara:strand:+ start:1021 stop:1329 length:309 start_codon:yes stop_codon:yes gene_type:complete
MIPKTPPLRDKKYLLWLRDQSCIITGQRARPDDAVEACHVGTAGKGLKSPDDEALPMLHSCHAAAHQGGEISYFREHLPNAVLRAAMRAYARELYKTWMEEQ